MGIHYVVACWSGKRRYAPPALADDPMGILRAHISSLSLLRHSLERVTFVVSENPDEHPSYSEYLSVFPAAVRGADLEIVRRPNIGYSYGAYSDIFDSSRVASHYMFMEDDHIFTLDGFDGEMLRMMEEDPRAGYVSFDLHRNTREWILGRISREVPNNPGFSADMEACCPETFLYPTISVGLWRAEALEAVWERFGRLPHFRGASHTECKFGGQFAQSLAVQKVGWNILDASREFRARGTLPWGETFEVGPKGAPLLLTSVQALNAPEQA